MENLAKIDQITSLHKNNELQLLCFRLDKDGDLYATNVFKIREVIKYDGEITKINYDRSSLLEGLITIRDLTIPLIDMKKWFYYDTRNKDKDLSSHIIKNNNLYNGDIVMICDFSRWTIGVRIYEADRILNKKWTEIEQSSGIVGSSNNNKLVGRTRYFDEQLVQIVDIEKMLVDVFPWIDEEKEEELKKIKKISSRKIILMADDSPVVLKTMQLILDKLGVEHNDFINGKKLLDYLFSSEVDISNIGMIITDLEMPETSGFEVIKQVKANPKTSHIPIVVNSSMSGSSNEEMAMSLNANEFISKSNPLEVEACVNKYL
ncbi:chemotaxis protein [Helicobacter sp. MIT 14-3879]|uniref:chemotaxis protein n=1 Tax=Helicobacter sp. MIT 14-3879 TaxID=2040649 RepID=UPI000E1F9D3D|nr:chemotaxis protein [Helicobacter sp. MIT 14-3879]RDU65012.1 chemotaxis protein CheV [Helicobacter sp. MIT 14-3879]